MATHARKRFGQHFLHDTGTLVRIADAVAPRPGEAVLEIGPGEGALTALLLERATALDAIEIDRDLAAHLRRRFAAAAFTLHEGDALQFDYGALAAKHGRRLRVVGNLPYNISTPLLFRLLGAAGAIQDMHVMLQKEVVDRMAAGPGDDDYGRLSVMLAPWVDIEKLFEIGPGAFRPPPRVRSAVARLTVLPAPRFAVPGKFAQVVAAAFSQRRKTLRNGLKAVLSTAQIEACGIDPGQRPERLSAAQFAALAAAVPA